MSGPLATTIHFTRAPSGARIAWARSGRGPVLVRVAHWMTHVEHDLQSPLWRPWLQRLGLAAQIVRYDERGCGLSGRDGQPPSLDSAVEDLAAVVQAAAEGPVALLGQSGAAGIAIAYAALHPERVSRLVLLGGYLCGQARAGDAATQAYLQAQLQLMRLGWGREGSAVQQYFTSTMVPDASREQAESLNEQQRLSCDGEHAAALMLARASLDVRAQAAALRMPTLVLHARGDLVVAPERGRDMAAAIPGARFETLDTRNHIPLPGDGGFEHFCDAIAAFLRDGEAPPPLTPRERELAGLLAQGLDNAQIAARLGLADKTVRNALSALYARLQVEGRAQAIVRIRDGGLG